jgi:hypothetical protein
VPVASLKGRAMPSFRIELAMEERNESEDVFK